MRLVVFDLDGTLVDSVEDIARSVNELRAERHRAPLPIAEIRRYVGDGVRKLIERSFRDASEEDLRYAHGRYLPIYRRRLLDHTAPSPGVAEALDELARAEKLLAVLTNKPRRESLMILHGLGLDRYFAGVYGGDSFESKKPDPTGLLAIVKEIGVAPAEALYVGDAPVDLETARNASVPFCLVSYGIGSEAAEALDPDYRIDDLRQLTAVDW